MALGDAFINVDADTDPFQRAINTDIPRIAKLADDVMEDIGEGWGKNLSDGAKSELRQQLPNVFKEFEKGAKAVRIRIGDENFLLDRNLNLRGVGGRFARLFQEESERAFASLARPGGPFSKIGEGLADAVGAGFNVSGRSPLIALLTVAIGALVGVIGAAVQALNAFVAILFTLPGLLAAVGLQGAVVFAAFQGIGEAATAAFSAKNATELNEAIKNLTPSAQEFVRSLLPIRDLFKQIQTVVQENFFAAFGDTLTRVAAALGPIVSGGMAQLATALGGLFRDLGLFFASPTFKEFLTNVIPETLKWLRNFGPSIIGFLEGLVSAGNAALPFLTRLGEILDGELKDFGTWLSSTVKSGEFQAWLGSMAETLHEVFRLFNAIVGFVFSFAKGLDEAGGEDLIRSLSEGLEQLIVLLESPVGEMFFKGLIDFGQFMIIVMFGLIDAFVLVFAAFGLVTESITAFFTWLTTDAWEGIKTFFTDLWQGFLDLGANIGNWVIDRIDDFGEFNRGIVEWINDLGQKIMDWFMDLPGNVVDWLGDMVHTLGEMGANAAKALVESLGRGISDAAGWLGEQARAAVAAIVSWLPGSPAEQGPLSGEGYSYNRGQRLVKDLAMGMRDEIPVVNNAAANVAGNVFNASLNFYGQQPSETQARAAGRAVAGEFNTQIAVRDARLAVRTM